MAALARASRGAQESPARAPAPAVVEAPAAAEPAAAPPSPAPAPRPTPATHTNEEPRITGSLAAFAGVFNPTVVRQVGASRADPYFLPGFDGRIHIPVPGSRTVFVLEGGFVLTVPFFPDGTTAGGEYAVRAGFALGNWRVSLGAWGRIDPAAAHPATVPTPSFSLRWQFYRGFAFTLGLFDRPGRSMIHAGLEHRYFGVQFAAFYGAEAYGRVPLRSDLLLEFRAFGYKFLGATELGGTVGLVWTPGYRPDVSPTAGSVW